MQQLWEYGSVHVQAFKHEHEQALGQLQRQLSSAKQGLAERDDIIQRFKQVSANDGVPSLATALHENQAMSPGPSQNGTSPVQVYSKYVALSQEHNKLRREHQKLQAEWEQVSMQLSTGITHTGSEQLCLKAPQPRRVTLCCTRQPCLYM